MSELVRAHAVTPDGDRHVSVSREYAESQGWKILDESAYSLDGQVRPETTSAGRALKPRTTVDKESTAKKAGKSATPTPPAKEIS